MIIKIVIFLIFIIFIFIILFFKKLHELEWKSYSSLVYKYNIHFHSPSTLYNFIHN